MKRALAPILKIRAALRERADTPPPAPAAETQDPSAANVVSIVDGLMLNWAGEEIAQRRESCRLVQAVHGELVDLRQLIAHALKGGEVSVLDRLMVFTKLEAAAGLTRQALNGLALACLALVLWISVAPDSPRVKMIRTGRGGAKVAATLRVGGRGLRKTEDGLV